MEHSEKVGTICCTADEHFATPFCGYSLTTVFTVSSFVKVEYYVKQYKEQYRIQHISGMEEIHFLGDFPWRSRRHFGTGRYKGNNADICNSFKETSYVPWIMFVTDEVINQLSPVLTHSTSCLIHKQQLFVCLFKAYTMNTEYSYLNGR